METTIKDVLHLYIGCEVSKKDDTDEHYQLGGILDNETSYLRSEYSEVCVANTRFKLLLTPLSDMTEEDALYCIKTFDTPLGDEGFKITGKDGDDWLYEEIGYEGTESMWSYNRKWLSIETFTYLLSKGYDLFNLIEKGEAINKNKK